MVRAAGRNGVSAAAGRHASGSAASIAWRRRITASAGWPLAIRLRVYSSLMTVLQTGAKAWYSAA